MPVPENKISQQGVGAVTDNLLNTYIQTVSSLSTLRNFAGVAGMEIELQGYVYPGDGGQGTFIWSPTAIGDNGTTQIQPNGITQGAWIRITATAPRQITLSGVYTNPGFPPGGTQFIDGWDLAVPVAFPTNFAGSTFHAEIAATSNFDIGVYQNGTHVGDLLITPTGYAWTTVSAVGFNCAIGDRITMVSVTGSPDATLNNFYWTLLGTLL